MKRALLLAWVACALCPGAEPDFPMRLRASIEKHLGRPYVWGATGIKSFDCSGFVWRVYTDSGVLLKRTTARKLWFSLPTPAPGQRYAFGNLVFFDDLKHVGIVDTRDTFYHAETSFGTNRSRFDPYWRRKLAGVRGAPVE
jgi:cell wall-associated NlpC family hydrolase